MVFQSVRVLYDMAAEYVEDIDMLRTLWLDGLRMDVEQICTVSAPAYS
jgi:hypothetical protein